MTPQFREYLENIIRHLEEEGTLEVDDGQIRPRNAPAISLSLVECLFSGGWLTTFVPAEYPRQGKPGYGTKLLITAPGPAWWSEQETRNAHFLAEKMEALAEANADLQLALNESSRKFNNSMRIIALSATVIALATLATTLYWMGASLQWW
ncbi:MAG: hypothetical protein ACFE0O_00940 [Opitutales bacterium]